MYSINRYFFSWVLQFAPIDFGMKLFNSSHGLVIIYYVLDSFFINILHWIWCFRFVLQQDLAMAFLTIDIFFLKRSLIFTLLGPSWDLDVQNEPLGLDKFQKDSESVLNKFYNLMIKWWISKSHHSFKRKYWKFTIKFRSNFKNDISELLHTA